MPAMEQQPAKPLEPIPYKYAVYGAMLVVMAAAWLYLFLTGGKVPGGTVTIGEDIRVRVDVVATPATRAQGLSGREGLAEDEGMLFLFDLPGKYQFWMKDMLFPIDIIWIREGRIVDLSVDVPPPGPDGSLPLVSPFEPADTVLEVQAGFSAAHGLRVGQPVSWEVDR